MIDRDALSVEEYHGLQWATLDLNLHQHTLDEGVAPPEFVCRSPFVNTTLGFTVRCSRFVAGSRAANGSAYATFSLITMRSMSLFAVSLPFATEP